MKTRGILTGIQVPFRSRRPVISLEVQAAPEDLEKLEDMDLDIELKKHRERRSMDANAMLWACIGEIASAVKTDTWSVYLSLLRNYGKFEPVLVRPEAVEDLKKQWRELEVVGERNITDGAGRQHRMSYVLCYYGSSSYDTAEFSRLLDGTLQEMQHIGLPLPVTRDVQAALEQWERKHDTSKRPEEEGSGVQKEGR